MAPRMIQPPKLSFPSRLPFEQSLDRALDSLSDSLMHNPILQRLEEVRSRFPEVAETILRTPMGTVRTPLLSIPQLLPPALDERRKEVIKAAIMDDVSGLIEKIPGLGIVAGPIADAIEDTAMRMLQTNLTKDELERFRSYDQVSPLTTLAAIQTFIGG